MAEDGWTIERYATTSDQIELQLGNRPLLESSAGYQPVSAI